MLVTILNKTNKKLPINSVFGSVNPSLSKAVDVTVEELETSRELLTELETKGYIAFTVVANPNVSNKTEGAVVASAGNGAVWTTGTVVPNANVVGSPGDLYTNTAGGAGVTLYVKESGVATNTGWVAK